MCQQPSQRAFRNIPSTADPCCKEGLGAEKRGVAKESCWALAPWLAGPPHWPLLADEPSGVPGLPPEGWATVIEHLSRPQRPSLLTPRRAFMHLPPRFLIPHIWAPQKNDFPSFLRWQLRHWEVPWATP